MNSNAPARRDTGNTTINLPHGSSAERVGQGTAVEQARATSEVYYRVLLAKQMPRDEERCIEQMRRSCRKLRLAEKAFYSMPRGGSTVDGPTVHLARELARIWGNIDYGIQELRQDDEYGQSEIQAFAWDLETNARPSQTFIVPHKRDAGRSTQKLTSMADIYQNNANMGARRVRQQIFAVLPDWFTEEAEEICRQTLTEGNGDELAERIRNASHGFKSQFGIGEDQLVTKVGKPTERWTAEDVASLTIVFRSLQQGEVTVEQAFPAAKVSSEEIRGRRGQKQQAPDDQPAEGTEELDQLDAERDGMADS